MEDGGDVSAASAGAESSGDVPAASAGADAFEDEVDLEIGEEQRKAIVKKEPHQPSQAEVDEHESTGHVVHRSWCLHCKRARVTADRHVPKELDEPETQLPTLSLDYFYMNQDQVADEATLPSIVAKCHKTKRFWASVLPGKGADAFAIAWLGGVLDDAGFNKVILKSDGEPSLVSLKQKVKEIKTHIEVHLVETPVEDHQANGFIEVGVREIKRQCRALLSDLEFKLERKVDPGHPLLVWLPRHAAFLLTRYRVGTDGKTAFERTYGRKWRIPLVRFGESILYRPRANRGGKRNDLAPRVSIGMYVGTGNRNSDVFVMTERGIMKGNSIHRRPPDDQFKHDQFDSLRGLPWRLQEREHGGLRIALPDVAAPRERPAVQEVIPRNLYVTKNDLEKHGHTPLCPGCEAAILEMPSRAHNAECRQRIQIELDKTPEGQERIKRARERELHKAGAQEARLHRLRVVGQKVVKLHHQLSQEGKLNNQSCKTVFLWMRKWMQVRLLVNHWSTPIFVENSDRENKKEKEAQRGRNKNNPEERKGVHKSTLKIFTMNLQLRLQGQPDHRHRMLHLVFRKVLPLHQQVLRQTRRCYICVPCSKM